MLGYQIQPLRKCKHTETAHQNPVIDDVNDILKCSVDGCEFGDVAMESNMLTNMWICVTTLKPFCGRCLNACGIKHAQETGNCVLIGYDDLSLWCYGESDGCKGCDNYVDPFAIEKIRPVFACVHKLKFGSEPNFPTITSTNRDDATSHCLSLILVTLPPMVYSLLQNKMASLFISAAERIGTEWENSGFFMKYIYRKIINDQTN